MVYLSANAQLLYQNNQKKLDKISRRTMIYNNKYYPFVEIPNYCTYFYQLPNQTLEFMQVPNYLHSSSEIQPFHSSTLEESQSQPQMDLQKTTQSTIQKMRVPDHESSSEQKVSKSTMIAPQKVELKQIVVPPCKDVKLQFRIDWKNQNRNIVPNLINQMISYLLKKIKSQKLVKKIFSTLPHDPSWTQKKFYLYMKKIKESITHYVNENVILKFLEIHEPKCELYDYDEQLFYMKVSRIAIIKFLEDDTVLISLTSNRMSEAKRRIHLIARQALLNKFKELCRQYKQ